MLTPLLTIAVYLVNISWARLLYHSVYAGWWPTQETIPYRGTAGATGGPGGPSHHPTLLLLHHQGGGAGGVHILSRTGPVVSNTSTLLEKVETITFILENPATDTLHHNQH